MVRTKADACVKTVGAKSTRKPLASTSRGSSSADSKGKQSNIGGNPYQPRETPVWQKEITSFFQHRAVQRGENSEECGASSSGSQKENTEPPKENEVREEAGSSASSS